MFCTKCGGAIEENAGFCPRCGTPVLAGATPKSTVEKKLVRPQGDKWIAGVCQGFARYFGVDVTLVRLIWLATVILAGTGILIYIICWIVIPQEYST